MAQIPIRMPKMSMTMTEGEVSEWFVTVGSTISEGDVICEVLTDKVDMEVESPATGVLAAITVESGSVDVGTTIGFIEGDDSGGLGDLLGGVGDSAAVPSEQAPSAAEPVAEVEPKREPVSAGPPAAVPRARGMAREQGIDLADVNGSGPSGRILVADVESVAGAPAAAAAAAPVAAPTPPTPAVPAAPAAPAPAPAAVPAQPVAPATVTPAALAEAKPPSRKRAALVRARVAAKMIESAEVPQFTVWRDLTLDEANKRRNKVSWTTVLLSAYSRALRDVPELRNRWENGVAVPTGAPSVGLAIDTPHGLLAPVIVSPDDEDPATLDQRVRALVGTAQSGRVESAYLQAANAMISNLGGLGVDRFQALVTPPQASVLSVGAIKQRPVAVPGGVGLALQVTVGLTVDHRVADGAHGARLLALLDQIVSNWGTSPR